MKIQEIHIYGFGQLSDVLIKDFRQFQVFYGENEAGKSTIMAFIHGILFGFPTKQQSTELRYEPKTDTRYGGKIKIVDTEFVSAVIERVKGKATGDVTVILEDGTSGGEELLNQLLKNMDKGIFQSVFSFSLHGLQNIHQMKGEELGRFLFSTGTLGTERLAGTEAELQKELENRFKPGGKKPLINEKLKAIHELNSELKKAAAKNLQYENHIEEKELAHQEIIQINQAIHDIQVQIEKLKEWKRIHSLVKEEKWLNSEITAMGELQFPARGIERLDKLNQMIYPYDAQISSLVERIDLLKNEIKTIQPEKPIIENESAILAGIEQIPLYEQFKIEKQQVESKLVEVEEKMAITMERLHLPLKEEEVLKINTNIYMKNLAEGVSRKTQRLLEVKEELENKFREEKAHLEELEEKVRFTERQILSQKEREKLEALANEEGNKRSIEIELRSVQDKLDFYLHTSKKEKETIEKWQKQRSIQLLTIEMILIVLTLYGVLTEQWFLVAFAILGCFIIGFFLVKSFQLKSNTGKDYQTVTKLQEKEKNLMDALGKYQNLNVEVLRERLNNDNRRREERNILQIKLEQQNTQYEKVISRFEEWEKENVENDKALQELCKELNIPENIARSYILEAFQLIAQYKVMVREKHMLRDRMNTIQMGIQKIQERLSSFSKQFLADSREEDLTKIAYLLRNQLKEENEKQIKMKEKYAKLDDFLADLNQIQQEQEHLKLERNKLLEEAGVQNEQLFFEIGKKAEKKIKHLDRLEDIKKQLQYTILKEEEWENYLRINDIEERIKHFYTESESLKTRLSSLQEKYASTKYNISLLEEGGIYSELLHLYKQRKFEIEESAKEWSVYCLAQSILSRTIEKYKNIHLPRMLAQAEEYLSFLTDGNYRRIFVQKSGTGFLIERKDHTVFEANELSQATTEQVYVSIRLALATTLYQKYHFPIIIDDSFVNFDARRTEKIMELLKSLNQYQILFFTCHSHLLRYFNSENVLSLQNGAVEVMS